MNKFVYYWSADKACVQDYYVDIILKSFLNHGIKHITLSSFDEVKKLPKDSYLILISSYCVLECSLLGFKNIFYWIQGVSPEESYMRNHSRLRRFISSIIELYALNKSRLCFLVSDGMIEHYKKKYKYDLSKKSYIMPCYNSVLNKESFFLKNKYSNNTFCYVGGLSVWQCFEETVHFYKSIEKSINNSKLLVLTPDVEKANLILFNENVENYLVKYVSPDKVLDEIKECKFGFILRGVSAVNFVATPTKLSNYLASGIIPIVTDSVKYFSNVLSNTKHAILLTDMNKTEKVIDFASIAINPNDIYKEYKIIFHKYFNTEDHINNITNLLSKHIK